MTTLSLTRWWQQPPNWFSWPSAEQSWRNIQQSIISLLWWNPSKGSSLRKDKSWRLWWLQATTWPGPALALWSFLPSLIHIQYTGLLAAFFCWLRNLEMAHSKHQINKCQLNQSDRAWNTLLLTQTRTTKRLWVWISILNYLCPKPMLFPVNHAVNDAALTFGGGLWVDRS